jgi:hypothetical protein
MQYTNESTPMPKSYPSPIQLRPTPDDERRLKELQKHLQQISPVGVRITRADVLRYCIQSSVSNISADTPSTLKTKT